MAPRIAARYISRRLSSGGKVLSEKEKAAGNVYIKGPKSSETPAGSVADAKPSGGASSTPNGCIKGPKPSETPAGSIADVKPSGDAFSDFPEIRLFVSSGIFFNALYTTSWDVHPWVLLLPLIRVDNFLTSENNIKTAASEAKFCQEAKFCSVVLVGSAAVVYCLNKLFPAEKVEGFEEKMGDDEASGSMGKKIYTDVMDAIKTIVFIPTAPARDTGTKLEAADEVVEKMGEASINLGKKIDVNGLKK